MIKIIKILPIFILLALCNMNLYGQEVTNDITKSRYHNENPEKAASEYYLTGKKLLLTGNSVEKAVKYFLAAVKLNPNHGATNFELAKLGGGGNALPHSLKAHQSDTTNFWYMEQLSNIYAQQRNFPMAIDIAKKMIEIRGDSDNSYKQLSSYYFYMGDIKRAFQVIDTIEIKFGETPELALMHSNMIRNINNPTDDMVNSVKSYHKLYDYIPNFSIALGDIYLKKGEDERAVNYYKQVSIIDPEDYRGDIALFDYYEKMKNQSESVKYLSSIFKSNEINVEAKISLYNKIISTNVFLYRNFLSYVDNASMSLVLKHPFDIRVRNIFSNHLLRKGDIAGALIFNKAGLDNNMVDFESLNLIVQIEGYNKNTDSMFLYLEKGFELFPERKSELNFSKAFIHVNIKEYDKAISIVKSEIKEISNDSILSIHYGSLGDIYHTAGENKKAYKMYNKSLKYNKNNIAVLNNYSYYLSLDKKKLNKALSMSLTAISIEPSNSTYIDTHAWVLYELGRYKEARDVIAKAVALDTEKNSSLVLHYGDILNKLDQRYLAEIYWLKALEYGESLEEIKKRMKFDENDPRLNSATEKNEK